jgi:deoxyribose-phosphate aldolase
MSETYRGLRYEQVASVIDHSLLRPELTMADVEAGCLIAARYRVASVCCRPADVEVASRLLAASGVAVGTVVAFPHGCSTTATKVFETRAAVADGATEIDMVLNIGWLRSGELDRVTDDIRSVVLAARGTGAGTVVKVILETAYLTSAEIVAACAAVEAAGGDYVKTSTGFAARGSRLEDVRLIRATVRPDVNVKAAGGIRTLDALIDAIEAGASRVGVSATAAILEEFGAVAQPDASPRTSA